MADAQTLRDRFPATFVSLGEGHLSRAHAQVILDEGVRLTDDEARGEYERVVLDRSAGLTTGRLRPVAKAVAEKLDPLTIGERHRAARERRGVWIRDSDDGMAELNLLGPAVLVHGIHDRLTQQARSVAGAESACGESAGGESAGGESAGGESAGAGGEGAGVRDERTLDQLRADILCDIVLTGHATTMQIDRDGVDVFEAFRPIVQVTIPSATLTGASDECAILNGTTPIDPDTARRLAGSATGWDRVLTDPHTGNIMAVDRRHTTEPLRRYLRARDEHCRFPGCRQPVWRSDIDHTIDHQHGGPTHIGNLAHLCRRHHTLKHHTAWRVEQQPGGILVWTSPLGRVHTDHPSPTLRFTSTP
jgi:hypothetical protein